MSKKTISLLLTICILLYLSACGTTEKSNNQTKAQPESQRNTTNSTSINTSREENRYVSSNNQSSKANDTAQTQNPASQSKPTSTTNQPTHTHSYSNATCTSPKKCSCGATAGTALDHQFSSATCTSPQICSRCGTTSGNTLGHSYSDANCNSPKTCARCGQTSGSALGHNYVNNKCSRCGKVDPDSLPVGLEKLTIIDKYIYGYSYQDKPFVDSFGNTYNGVHYYEDVFMEAYTIHNLNNKFSVFSGSIVASSETESGRSFSIWIYVDDELKYTKTGFSKTTGKTDFSISVKNGMKLTIKIDVEQSGTSWHDELGIVNAQLTK